MINIVCFWSEPEPGKPDIFTQEYVVKLKEGIDKYVNGKYNFICYSDRFNSSYVRPLVSNLKGWWAKLTLFGRPELRDTPTLYLDLDTIIVDKIYDICKYVERTKKFTILRDFYRQDGYGSGMMSWNGDYRYVWDAFAQSPGSIMNKYGGVMGDQWFLETQIKNANFWQDEFPNQIVSYKIHCGHGKPDGASVVCFHGAPRPHEVEWKV